MAMTRTEVEAKKLLVDLLIKEGRPSYAKLLLKMELNLTQDPSVVGYMIPDKAKIVINQNLRIEQVSTIVRHEILHEYLTHMQRSEAWKEKNADKRKDIINNSNFHQLVNIAGDFEISNVGYTDDDKNNSRAIILGDKLLRGLVTEDDPLFKGCENMSFEELLDKLCDNIDDLKDQIKQSGDLNNTGDAATQAAEEAERQANAAIDDLGNEVDQGNSDSDQGDGADSETAQDQAGKAKESQAGDGDDSKDAQDKAKEIAKQAGKLKQAAKANQDPNSPFRDADQVAKDAAIKKRADELKKAIEELIEDQALEREDKNVKASHELKKYMHSPLKLFMDSLTNFIKKVTGINRGPTWSRINNRHYYNGVIVQGTSNFASEKVPLINVYFDRSPSWSDPAKSEVGYKAVSALNRYVKEGKLKVNLYYFSTRVCSTEDDALSYLGTDGQPIMNHIQKTKPDNVIIITDSDISDITGDYSVPGGVWLLFVDGVSANLQDHFRGKKLTRSFQFYY